MPWIDTGTGSRCREWFTQSSPTSDGCGPPEVMHHTKVIFEVGQDALNL